MARKAYAPPAVTPVPGVLDQAFGQTCAVGNRNTGGLCSRGFGANSGGTCAPGGNAQQGTCERGVFASGGTCSNGPFAVGGTCTVGRRA